MDQSQVALLKQGAVAWNAWREEHREVESPDLSEADLRRANLAEANLSQADLRWANLEGANLVRANLIEANLFEANLWQADLSGADLIRAMLTKAELSSANLTGADLTEAGLTYADLSHASLKGANLTAAVLPAAKLREADLTEVNLSGANLWHATMIGTNIDRAILMGCAIYGLSVWDIKGAPKDQSNLIITPEDAPMVTVDDLEVAQFIYLILNRAKLRNVLNTITSKAVLVLGRFTPERKVVLDGVADELRKYNLLPIIFDFERATSQDFTETIKTLAGLSLFVIVDITNPKSAPLELQAIVPDYQIPFVPIIQEGEEPFSMFSDLKGKYDWVLMPVITYPSLEKLRRGFKSVIIDRAWRKHQELRKRKTQETEVLSIDDFLKTEPNG